MYFFLVLCSILTLLSSTGGSLQRRKCEPLTPNVNVAVTCAGPKIQNDLTSKSCEVSQEPGTIATYKCKNFFTPIELKPGKVENEASLRCGGNGVWAGLAKFQAYRCKEDCGNVEGNSNPLVVNGLPTYRSFHPWHAMLFVKNEKDDWIYLCGASIIRSQVLLTAAHCIVAGADRYRVLLGGVSTNFSRNTHDTGARIYAVQRFYVSENYDPRKGYQADIALVQLTETAEYNNYISPVCLPNDYSADVSALRNGVVGQIAGFGLTENGTVPESLRLIQLGVKSSTECYNSLKRILSESQFCAGSKQGEVLQTVCNGDSGNGMTFLSSVHHKYFIHGLVSSSDADARKGVCQNYAVFTRIYPFVFWIRDVLEEISGEVGREFPQNVPYPYVLHGNEVQFKVYKSLPTEWENRITKLDLQYTYLPTDDLLASLEYAKTLNSIQCKNIVLDSPRFNQKIALPLLTEFHLDILRPDVGVDDLGTFSEGLTETFIKSQLFFFKDYSNREWLFPDLLNMKVDVDLILHIFKILHINATRGEVYMNQVPFANKIFDNTNNEFQLRRLALRATTFDISSISSSKLTSLILDNVELIGKNQLSTILKFSTLKSLVLKSITFPRQESVTVLLDQFSKSLECLTLSSSLHVTIRTAPTSYKFRIIFPDEDLSNRRESTRKVIVPLNNLKTFCCDSCSLNSEIWNNFEEYFPNILTLLLRTDQSIPLKSILESRSLKSVHVDSKSSSNFEGISDIVGQDYLNFKAIKLEKKGNVWSWTEVSPTEVHRAHYKCNGGNYFWTSEEDYQSKLRLKTFEQQAFSTGKYVFQGHKYGQEQRGSTVRFAGIPPEIQQGLKSIVLKNVEVTPRTLSDSIEQCKNLRSITLLNTEVIGNGLRYTFDTQNLTFVLDSFKFVNFEFEYIYEYVNDEFVAAVIPFQHFGKFNASNSTNTLSRVFKDVNSARLELNRTTTYIFDSTMLELRSSYRTIRRIITNLPQSHQLKPMLQNLIEIQMTYKDSILPPEWGFPGLQIIDQHLVKRFYQDSVAQIFGNLGIIRFLVKRYGKYLSLASLSLTAFQNQTNAFPPIQAISLSLIRDRYLTSIIQN